MTFKNDWAEAVGGGDDEYQFHTLELALEYFDCQSPDQVPETLQCFSYKTPEFEASDLVDSLWEQLRDNYRNDDGYITDFIDDKAQLALIDAIQPLIDKLLIDCGWKQYEPTEFEIDLILLLREWREKKAQVAAGIEQ